MEIGPSVTQAKDDAWNPKVRVKNVGGKTEPRPTRDGAKKVTAVEMGLKLAAERRRKPKVTPKKKAAASKKPAPSQQQQQQPPQQQQFLLQKSPSESSPTVGQFTRSPFLSTPTASRLGVATNAKILSATKFSTPSQLSVSKLASPASVSLTSSQIKKSKKGMLTAKQRIAKTLGLKF